MWRRCWIRLAMFALIATGCDSAVDSPTGLNEPPLPKIGREFDPATTGSIVGRVDWAGTIPEIPPIRAAVFLPNSKVEHRTAANPNAPRINPTTRAVAGIVVIIDGVAPQQAAPWAPEPTRVELFEDRLRVSPGDGRIGIVRQGDEIEMVSRDSGMLGLAARGTEFFSFMFPDQNQPLFRRLTKLGAVELRSAAARSWQRAHLIVSDHPYVAVTDAAGRFRIDRVPAGSYTLRCWHPNWEITGKDLDPNTGQVLRLHFGEPLQWKREIDVAIGATTEVECVVGR